MNDVEFLLSRLDDARAVAADTSRRSAESPNDLWLIVAARNQQMIVCDLQKALGRLRADGGDNPAS